MATYDAVDAIRSYLADNDGTSDALVGQLLTSFHVSSDDEKGKVAIQQSLTEAGVGLDRSIEGLAADDPVVLHLASNAALTPGLSSGVAVEAVETERAPELGTSPNGDRPPPPPPPAAVEPPDGDGGLTRFVRRRPREVFWATLGTALVVGIGIGAAGASDPQTKEDLKDTRAQLSDTRADLTGERDRSSGARERLATANERIQELTAKGEVPNLRGKDIDGIQPLLDKYEWTVARSSQVSTSRPGTIVSQSPAAGEVLKAGKEIRLTVAKPAPPSWKTLLTLSGSGSKRTDEFQIPAGKKVRVQYTFNGESNDTIQVKDPAVGDDEFGDLIFNEIGAKSGTTRLYGAEGSKYLDVSGDSWTIQVQVFK